jgi:very-short-patch-repair endonuclease
VLESLRRGLAVTRTARIPTNLRLRPFTLEDAQRAGLRRWHLEGAAWRRVGPKTYVAANLEDSPMLRLLAAARRIPSSAVFSGLTAAWLHGLDVSPCDPIEVTAPVSTGIGARVGIKVRRTELREGDVVMVRGLPATTIVRTLRDMSARLSLTEAVVLCDLALHAGLLTVAVLNEATAMSSGLHGVVTLRKAMQHVEPAAESPMETRLRMLLVAAGLPRPEAQVEIRDELMRFVGRLDLYYRAQRLGLEYDGATHRENLVEDNRRQNRLLNAGVRLLRFTAGDIYHSRGAVVSQVRRQLNTVA